MTAFRDRVRRRRACALRIRRRARARQPIVCNPPVDTEVTIEAIVALVSRTYPRSGNQLEAAARLAARLGWEACHRIESARS